MAKLVLVLCTAMLLAACGAPTKQASIVETPTTQSVEQPISELASTTEPTKKPARVAASPTVQATADLLPPDVRATFTADARGAVSKSPKVGDCYSTAIAAPWPGSDPDASLAIPREYLQSLGLEYSGGGPPEPRSPIDARLRTHCGKQLFVNEWNREGEGTARPVGLLGIQDRRLEFQSASYAQAFLSEALPALLQEEGLKPLSEPTRLPTKLAIGDETRVYRVEVAVPASGPAGAEMNVHLYIFQWRVGNIVAEVAVGGDERLNQKQAFAIAQAAAERVDAALNNTGL